MELIHTGGNQIQCLTKLLSVNSSFCRMKVKTATRLSFISKIAHIPEKAAADAVAKKRPHL